MFEAGVGVVVGSSRSSPGSFTTPQLLPTGRLEETRKTRWSHNVYSKRYNGEMVLLPKRSTVASNVYSRLVGDWSSSKKKDMTVDELSHPQLHMHSSAFSGCPPRFLLQ